jgi:hypothetical protein
LVALAVVELRRVEMEEVEEVEIGLRVILTRESKTISI